MQWAGIEREKLTTDDPVYLIHQMAGTYDFEEINMTETPKLFKRVILLIIREQNSRVD